MAKFTLFYPVKPLYVNQVFGVNPQTYAQFGLAGHNGIDLRAFHGQKVFAAHDGVCFPEIDNSGGNGVIIRSTGEFDFNGKQVHFKTIYWHLDRADAVVKTGQKVKAGDLIGYADNTGFSTGDHLHFGLKPQEWNETDWSWGNSAQNNGFLGAIDPTPYWNGFYAEDAAKLFGLYGQLIPLLTALRDALKPKP